MQFVVITGPSGAGKTLALQSFEDARYYTADNIPPRLLPALVDYCRADGWARAAVVSDVRSGAGFAELPAVLEELKARNVPIEILFLDANDAALVQRFKETRRPHPLLSESMSGGIVEAIHAERALLQTARADADHILDTSSFTPGQLRDLLHSTYSRDTRPGLVVMVTSFGFKHGLPIDADLVLDVRFLANPHYDPDLKALSGLDERVAAFVHADDRTAAFQRRMNELVDFSLPQYRKEGKAYLNIAIGCTGGQHRSVLLAHELAVHLRDDGYHVGLRHRDMMPPPSTEAI